MGRRRVMPGSDYRAAMYGTGDVRVGASGRVWLRKRILLGLAGAALIGAAAWLLILMRPPDADCNNSSDSNTLAPARVQ